MMEISPLLNTIQRWTRLCVVTASAAGLFLNFLIILIILKHSKMRTVTNVYVLNLAIFDSLNAIVVFAHHSSHLYTSKLLCGLYNAIYVTVYFGQGFQVALLSLDRCVSVCYPTCAKQFRGMRYAFWTSLTIWALSQALAAPYVVHTTILDDGICTFQWDILWEDILGCVFGFFLPTTITLIAYVHILFKLKSMRFQDKHSQKIRKLTLFVIVIVSVHVLLSLPYWTLEILNLIINPSSPTFELNTAEHIGYLQCFVNPIMYAVINVKFRHYLFRYLTLKAFFVNFDNTETQRSTNTPTHELNQM